MNPRGLFLAMLAQVLIARPALTQEDADGSVVFETTCAACHGNPDIADAPGIDVMREFPPGAIVNTLVNGKMQPQGALLTEEARIAVAEFITGRPVDRTQSFFANRCEAAGPVTALGGDSDWNGWGNGLANRRFAEHGGLTASDLSGLELKWAFGYADVVSARAQPSYAGGRLFVASENSEVHALDPKTGCTYWTYQAGAGVRTAIVVGPYVKADGTSGLAAYFGDMSASAYAVDADSGEPIWTRELDTHPGAAITGPPVVFDGRAYFPTQGLNEEGSVVRVDGGCCTFRGRLAALDASTGETVWNSFTISEPKPRGRNDAGVQGYGPSGGGIWSPATIDPARGLIYVATGNGYTGPPQPTTNAVIAIDMRTGEHRWVNQVTPGDLWAAGCGRGNPICPEDLGPDADFSAPPALVSTGDRDLLVLPQKSGMAYAIDAERHELVWQYRLGPGVGLGGQWGGATDGRRIYIGASSQNPASPAGIHAIDLATGERAWYVPATDPLCAGTPQCRTSQGGATTLIPGAVFSGSHDGGMRAYSTEDGALLWLFDTNREFETVNGVAAHGGSMDGPGAIVADGMLYFNSGYGGFGRKNGNVLLAFGPAD